MILETEHISPEFIESCLSRTGFTSSIDDFTITPIEHDGAQGRLSILNLKFDKPSCTPTQFIIKQTNHESFAAEIQKMFRCMEREAWAYNQPPDFLGPRTPASIYAAHDPDSDRMLVIQEFIEDGVHKPIPLLDTQESINRMCAIGDLHGKWWNRTSLEEQPLLVDYAGANSQFSMAIFLNLKREFEMYEQKFGDGLGDTWSEVTHQLLNKPELRSLLATGPQSLVHGDYHGSNLMFLPDGQVTVFDWNWLGLGTPGIDFSMLLRRPADDYREHITATVDAYAEHVSKVSGEAIERSDVMECIRVGQIINIGRDVILANVRDPDVIHTFLKQQLGVSLVEYHRYLQLALDFIGLPDFLSKA